MADPEGRCETCRFFHKEDCWTMDGTKVATVCRRFPPVPKSSMSAFPYTGPYSWCGEYEAER